MQRSKPVDSITTIKVYLPCTLDLTQLATSQLAIPQKYLLAAASFFSLATCRLDCLEAIMSKMSTCANSNNQLASSGRFGQVLFLHVQSISISIVCLLIQELTPRKELYFVLLNCSIHIQCFSCYDVTRIFAAFRARTLVRNFHENLRHFAAFPKCADISRTVLHGYSSLRNPYVQ